MKKKTFCLCKPHPYKNDWFVRVYETPYFQVGYTMILLCKCRPLKVITIVCHVYLIALLITNAYLISCSVIQWTFNVIIYIKLYNVCARESQNSGVNVLFNMLNILHCIGNKTAVLLKAVLVMPNKMHRSCVKVSHAWDIHTLLMCFHLPAFTSSLLFTVTLQPSKPCNHLHRSALLLNISVLSCCFMTLYSYDGHCNPSIKHALFINGIDTQSTWYFCWLEASNALILPVVESLFFFSSIN